MNKICYALTAVLLVLCSCGNTKASGQTNNETQAQDSLSFTLPEIPAMLTTPELRAEFLVKHYWDKFNFADTVIITHPEITEQAWVDYINIMPYVPLEIAHQGMARTIEQAANNRKTYDYFTGLADKYLYDPNSPFMNEEYYIPVLESMVNSNLLSDAEKIRPKDRLDMAMKNRLGHKATDFTYTLASSKQGKLSGINSQFTLLFFNNPGCHACGETIAEIANSMQIQYLLSKNEITILSVYPDEEMDEWKRHHSDIPAEWINAYDKSLTIRDKNLYDLKAIPTLYLLDKDKNVLLKDARFIQIEDYLRNQP